MAPGQAPVRAKSSQVVGVSTKVALSCMKPPTAMRNAMVVTRALLVRPIFQNVAGLTIERAANVLQRVEAHALDLAGLQQRDVLLGDADALGELLGAHLAPRQHHVEVDDDRHHTKPAFSSAMRAASRMTVAAANSTPPTISAK